MTAKGRTLLGKHRDLSGRQRVYVVDDAIEVDSYDHYNISRQRVFFDDVVFITYHKMLGWQFLVMMGLLTAILGLIAALVSQSEMAASLVFAGVGLIPAIAFILRLALKVDVITVYGKRSKASMSYAFRKSYAHRIYGELVQLTQSRQEKLAAEIADEISETAQGEMPMPEVELKTLQAQDGTFADHDESNAEPRLPSDGA